MILIILLGLLFFPTGNIIFEVFSKGPFIAGPYIMLTLMFFAFAFYKNIYLYLFVIGLFIISSFISQLVGKKARNARFTYDMVSFST